MVLKNTFARDNGVKSFASHLFETAQQSSNFTNIPRPRKLPSLLYFYTDSNSITKSTTSDSSQQTLARAIRKTKETILTSPLLPRITLRLTSSWRREIRVRNWRMIPKKRNSKKCERKKIQRISGYSKPPMAKISIPGRHFIGIRPVKISAERITLYPHGASRGWEIF